MALASYTDLKQRIVPDLLLLASLAAAVAFQALQGSLPLMLWGVIAGAVIGLILRFLGAIAMGDVKLLAVLGAWLPYLFPVLILPFPVLLMLSTILVSGVGISLVGLVRPNIFRERKMVVDLKEGDVPVDLVVVQGSEVRIVPDVRPSAWLKRPGSARKELQELVSSKGARVLGWSADGFSEGEVTELQDLAKAGRLPQELALRKTMPLVPAIFLTFVILVGLIWFFINPEPSHFVLELTNFTIYSPTPT